MKQILKIFLAPLIGLLAVVIALEIESLFHSDTDDSVNPIIYTALPQIVGLMSLGTLVFQALVILPLTNNFKNGKKIFALNGFVFVAVTCLACGIIFGFLFWHKSFGYRDLLIGSIIWTVLTTIYLTTNLFVLNIIENRFQTRARQYHNNKTSNQF